MKYSTMATASAFAVVAMTASAMTFSELQSAIDAAPAGGTVEVTSDVEYAAPLSIAKQVTLRSPAGMTNEIRRAATYASGTFLSLADAAADVTLQNLIVDGNKAAGRIDNSFITISAGRLTLDDGATLRNAYPKVAGTIFLEQNGSGQLVMEDGSVIRGMENDGWGVGIAVRKGSTFKMNGGLITECAGHYPAKGLGYDGAVYVYDGFVEATGGTISGNTSEKSTAGLNVWSGEVNFGGTFTVIDNVGGSANNFCKSGTSASFRVLSDYFGWMTIRLGATAEEGLSPSDIWTYNSGTPRKGCMNIVSEEDPTLGLDMGVLSGGWYPTWRKIVARIESYRNVCRIEDAYNEYRAGDTITLLNDAYIAATWIIDKDLTLRGVGGTKWFKRAKDDLCLLVASNAKLRLENIAIDGNRDYYKNGVLTARQGLVAAEAGGTVELGRGTVLRNASSWFQGSAMSAYGAGAKIIMEDGAVISNCTAHGTQVIGVVAMIGNGEDVSPRPKFEMRGGRITGNDDGVKNTRGISTWDSGIVALNFGDFDMSGGEISGNRSNSSSSGCAAVNGYQGTMTFSGTARIENNQGGFPGICVSKDWPARILGDFRGHIEVSGDYYSETALTKDHSYPIQLTDGATGAWCFETAGASEGKEFVGVVDDRYTPNKIKWEEPVGSIGGVKVGVASDFAYIFPQTLVLSNATVRTALPIVFTGAATELSGTIKLAYDPNVLRTEYAEPIKLVAAGVGETYVGKVAFELPAYQEGVEGYWRVRSWDGAKYALKYIAPGELPGLMLIFR